MFKLFGNYGFPVIVASYLLVRLEPLIRSLDRSVAVLTAVIERQAWHRPDDGPGGTGGGPAGTAGWPLLLDGRPAPAAGGREDNEAPGPGLYAGGPGAETGANGGSGAGVPQAQAEKCLCACRETVPRGPREVM